MSSSELEPLNLSQAQLQQIAAQVATLSGPGSVGEGFANPVASIFQAGNTTVITSAGLFIYSGTPALGNLLLSATPVAGTDAYGNVYPMGLNVTTGAISGTVIEGTDIGGGVVSKIDQYGNINTFNAYGQQIISIVPALDAILLYADTASFVQGGLLVSIAGEAGTDFFGNAIPQGININALAGLTNTFSVEDASGNLLANVDSSGNINGQTVSAAVDVLVGGNSVAAFMASQPGGIINRAFAPGNSSTGWPATAITAANGITAMMELDVTVPAGRSYMVQVLPCDVLCTTAPSAGTQFIQRLFYTSSTSGTPATPTTSSTEPSGHSPAVQQIAASVFNFMSPYMEYILPTPAVPTSYRILLAGQIQTSGAFKYDNNLEMRVVDNGVDNGQFGQGGVLLGTGAGTGGGSGGKQTYTELFYASSSWSYYSNSGLRNTNGNMYHGAYSGESPNYQYSYIQWATGSLGNSLNTVLGAGYTVNDVTLRLTNLHSWYNSGMTWGLHSSTTSGYPSPVWSVLLTSAFISEGNTYTYTLGSGTWSPFAAAGTTYAVLVPDAGDLTNLSWYGYFAGAGASSSQKPLLTVNYTH